MKFMGDFRRALSIQTIVNSVKNDIPKDTAPTTGFFDTNKRVPS